MRKRTATWLAAGLLASLAPATADVIGEQAQGTTALIVVVPEPSTLLLLGVGLGALALLRLRHRVGRAERTHRTDRDSTHPG